MKKRFKSPFAIGERVCADFDANLIMIVTGIQWRGDGYVLVCGSWHVGGVQGSAWFEAWRLTSAEIGQA